MGKKNNKKGGKGGASAATSTNPESCKVSLANLI